MEVNQDGVVFVIRITFSIWVELRDDPRFLSPRASMPSLAKDILSLLCPQKFQTVVGTSLTMLSQEFLSQQVLLICN